MGMFHCYVSLPEGIYRSDFVNTSKAYWESMVQKTDWSSEISSWSPSIMEESEGMDLGYASFNLSLPPTQ